VGGTPPKGVGRKGVPAGIDTARGELEATIQELAGTRDIRPGARPGDVPGAVIGDANPQTPAFDPKSVYTGTEKSEGMPGEDAFVGPAIGDLVAQTMMEASPPSVPADNAPPTDGREQLGAIIANRTVGVVRVADFYTVEFGGIQPAEWQAILPLVESVGRRGVGLAELNIILAPHNLKLEPVSGVLTKAIIVRISQPRNINFGEEVPEGAANVLTTILCDRFKLPVEAFEMMPRDELLGYVRSCWNVQAGRVKANSSDRPAAEGLSKMARAMSEIKTGPLSPAEFYNGLIRAQRADFYGVLGAVDLIFPHTSRPWVIDLGPDVPELALTGVTPILVEFFGISVEAFNAMPQEERLLHVIKFWKRQSDLILDDDTRGQATSRLKKFLDVIVQIKEGPLSPAAFYRSLEYPNDGIFYWIIGVVDRNQNTAFSRHPALSKINVVFSFLNGLQDYQIEGLIAVIERVGKAVTKLPVPVDNFFEEGLLKAISAAQKDPKNLEALGAAVMMVGGLTALNAMGSSGAVFSTWLVTKVFADYLPRVFDVSSSPILTDDVRPQLQRLEAEGLAISESVKLFSNYIKGTLFAIGEISGLTHFFRQEQDFYDRWTFVLDGLRFLIHNANHVLGVLSGFTGVAKNAPDLRTLAEQLGKTKKVKNMSSLGGMLNFIGFVNTSELKGDQKVVAITDDEGMPDITVHRSRIPAWWAIINELVTNAARKYYNRDIDDKMVYLTAFEDGDSVRIIVADNGVGIPDDAVDSVFKGKRLRKDLANGDGLGLRGIKAEVEKMGGKVEINPDMSGINVPDEVEGMLDGMVTVMMITVSRSDLESEKTP
jgi:hypothetical protein